MSKWWLVLGFALAFLSSLGARSEAQNVMEKRRAQEVFIVGSVASQGIYELKPDETVGQLIARAGGLLAAPGFEEVKINRAGAVFVVDMKKAAGQTLLEPKVVTPDFLLSADDVVAITVNPREIYVIGQVLNPGKFPLPEDGVISLSQALILAGGVLGKNSNTEFEIRRNHADGEIEALKISGYAPNFGDTVLRDGDRVSVREKLRRVYVSGDVVRLGFVTFPETDTFSVAQALALAGGVRDGRKNITVRITRENGAGKLEWRELATATDLEKELLQDDDFLGVSIKKRQVYVGGEVIKPGFVEMPDDGKLSIAQAITLAGGLRNADAEFKITLMRKNAEGKTELLDIPWNTKDLFNQPLQNGDMLVIMPKITSRFGPRIAPPTAYLWLLQSR